MSYKLLLLEERIFEIIESYENLYKNYQKMKKENEKLQNTCQVILSENNKKENEIKDLKTKINELNRKNTG